MAIQANDCAMDKYEWQKLFLLYPTLSNSLHQLFDVDMSRWPVSELGTAVKKCHMHLRWFQGSRF